MVIDPDAPLSQGEQSAISQGYANGSLSMLISEGNTTNNAFLTSSFGASVSGALISDPASTFSPQSVFYVDSTLTQPPVTGVLDFASPLVLRGSSLSPVAYSPASSVDSLNSTAGRRVVMASGESSAGSRALLITDHNPFTNRFLSASMSSLNDTRFVDSMLSWVTASGRGAKVVIDNAHYVSKAPGFSFGIPVGAIALFALQAAVGSCVGGTGAGLGSGGLFGGLLGLVGLSWIAVVINLLMALLVVRFIRNRLKGVYATDRVVKDDQPVPQLERSVAAQSRERSDFLAVSRSKSFYVATCAQLYEVVDDISNMEFAQGAASLTPEKLSPRIGPEEAQRATSLIAELARLDEYASGKKRFLFPPVFSWKRKVSTLTTHAESFLNALGVSMKGAAESKQLEYMMKR